MQHMRSDSKTRVQLSETLSSIVSSPMHMQACRFEPRPQLKVDAAWEPKADTYRDVIRCKYVAWAVDQSQRSLSSPAVQHVSFNGFTRGEVSRHTISCQGIEDKVLCRSRPGVIPRSPGHCNAPYPGVRLICRRLDTGTKAV